MTARMFRLVDQKGNLRALLGSNKEGVPGLVMLDPKGRHRAYFNLTEKGPGLDLLGPDGSIRLALAVDDKGEPSIYLLIKEIMGAWASCR